MVAWADPQLAMQIITNLVQNAGRYAPDGEIEMMVERRENAAVLSISDDGPGINPEEGEELFAVGSSHKGLGIGLSLSRQLARAMDGDLILDRPLRQGATFSLVLPFAADAKRLWSHAKFERIEHERPVRSRFHHAAARVANRLAQVPGGKLDSRIRSVITNGHVLRRTHVTLPDENQDHQTGQ